ncbi:alpha-amylase family glycosyl hydrolase, partial [Schleiferiaceae bacterium]|nr:alpha-amylase family glycosyl hydrolase [Schleiferiaceae bacterium]
MEKIEPPSWWKGMTLDTVEFMVYGSGIDQLKAQSKTLHVIKSESLTSPDYLFVTIHIPSDILVGQHKLTFTNIKGKRVGSLLLEIQERRPQSSERKSFSSADNIYLLMPDRFCNGNSANDNVKGMLETTNRILKGGRHGGDLEGIEKHLEYFKDIGMTALWLNPVLENNMPEYSYHGYAMTDLYKVDSRYGSNEEYQQLSSRAKQMGIGIIMDQVANHIGSYHPWIANLPSGDWLNQWEEFTPTNHMKVSRFDPHSAAIDQKVFHDGWFVSTMPDLNQRQPKLAKYLIQNSIWWIEYADLYGIRMDTWSYPDKQFLADWTKGILTEYPNFNIVGEEWVSDPSLISYWQSNVIRGDDYDSYLPSIMDFPLQSAVTEGLKGETAWRSS